MFDQAMEHVLRWEGGYVDDPDDPGGETKYGISKRAHPDVDVANLTEDEAKQIYQREYWVPAGCDRISYGPLALAHMDAAVNVGVRKAITFLQLATGAHPDGVFGPRTHEQVSLLVAWGHADEVIKSYTLLRVQHYTKLAHGDPNRLKFLTGWLRRTLSTVGLRT